MLHSTAFPKLASIIRISISGLFGLFFCGLVYSGEAVSSEETNAGVELDPGNCRNACVIVFGKVGEPFEYALSDSDGLEAARYWEGLNASGESCRLPQGVTFDAATLTLQGVPRRAGFHEFVLMATEKGVTKERVVLIDIQSRALPAEGVSYAAYFLGGVR